MADPCEAVLIGGYFHCEKCGWYDRRGIRPDWPADCPNAMQSDDDRYNDPRTGQADELNRR